MGYVKIFDYHPKSICIEIMTDSQWIVFNIFRNLAGLFTLKFLLGNKSYEVVLQFSYHIIEPKEFKNNFVLVTDSQLINGVCQNF